MTSLPEIASSSRADLDGDGREELLITAANGVGVLAFRSRGDGGFDSLGALDDSWFSTAWGWDPPRVTRLDLRGDGRARAVAFTPSGRLLELALGDGGVLEAGLAYDLYELSAAPMLADVNGDGLPDLIAVGTSSVRAFLAEGGGAYRAFRMLKRSLPPSIDFAGAGDLDGDGLPDLAGVTGCGSGVDVYRNLGDGGFDTRAWDFEQSAGARAFNLTGDGHAQMVFAGGYAAELGVFDLGGTAVTVPVDAQLNDLIEGGDPQLGDFGPHGETALLVASPYGPFNDVAVLPLLFDGGRSSVAETLTLNGIQHVVAADLDHDGRLDAAVTSSQGLFVAWNSGAGLDPLQQVSRDPLTAAIAADFNGDGVTDLAASTTDGGVAVFFGRADRQLGPHAVSLQGLTPVRTFATGDLDGDGVTDLVVDLGDRGAAAPFNTIAVLHGNGDGTFRILTTIPRPTTGVVAADLNCDGRDDLVIPGGGQMEILYSEPCGP